MVQLNMTHSVHHEQHVPQLQVSLHVPQLQVSQHGPQQVSPHVPQLQVSQHVPQQVSLHVPPQHVPQQVSLHVPQLQVSQHIPQQVSLLVPTPVPQQYSVRSEREQQPEDHLKPHELPHHYNTFVVDRFLVTKYDLNGADEGATQDQAHLQEPVDEFSRRSSQHSSASSRSRRDSVYPNPGGGALPETHGLCAKLDRCLDPAKRLVQRVTSHPLCPDHTWLLRMLAMIIIGALFFCVAILMIGGAGWFHIITAVVIAQVVGHLVHKATSLPPLLGMLAVGACVRQLGFIDKFSSGHDSLVYVVRSAALVSLLVRTAFRLDPAGVRRLPAMMVALAVIPGFAEGLSVTLLGHFLLGMPWQWSSLLGIILSAVCPSVLIPCFHHMGAGRSVNAVLVAAACLNDLLVIFAYGVTIALIFTHVSSFPYVILHRVMGMACGTVLGVTFGLFAKYVPEQKDPHVASLRSLLLASLGMFTVIGFAKIGFFGGGPFTVVVATFVSCRGWRAQGWGEHYNPVATVYEVLWRIMEPVMFCLIGAELRFPVTPAGDILLGVAVLCAAWTIRIIVSLLVTASAGDLNVKERFFVTLAWMPKAGVQAALCPLALELTSRWGDQSSEDVAEREEMLGPAKAVMLMVLLAVVLTAPLSAALTTRRGLVSVLVKNEDSRGPPGAS